MTAALALNPDDWKGAGDWDDMDLPADQLKRLRIKEALKARAEPKKKRDNEWPQAEIDLMVRLWMEGRSASQISREMGTRTRNAIIGRVDRMGLVRADIFNRANQADAMAKNQRRSKGRRGQGWVKGNHHLFKGAPLPRRAPNPGRKKLPEELDRTADVLLFRPPDLLDEGFDTIETGWGGLYAEFQMAA